MENSIERAAIAGIRAKDRNAHSTVRTLSLSLRESLGLPPHILSLLHRDLSIDALSEQTDYPNSRSRVHSNDIHVTKIEVLAAGVAQLKIIHLIFRKLDTVLCAVRHNSSQQHFAIINHSLTWKHRLRSENGNAKKCCHQAPAKTEIS